MDLLTYFTLRQTLGYVLSDESINDSIVNPLGPQPGDKLIRQDDQTRLAAEVPPHRSRGHVQTDCDVSPPTLYHHLFEQRPHPAIRLIIGADEGIIS
jgi:hypothetical protein